MLAFRIAIAAIVAIAAIAAIARNRRQQYATVRNTHIAHIYF